MKINLREALNSVDKKTDNKFNLLNLYESVKLSEEDKKELTTVLYSAEDPEVIYDQLMKKFEEKGFEAKDHNSIWGQLEEVDEDFDSEEKDLVKDQNFIATDAEDLQIGDRIFVEINNRFGKILSHKNDVYKVEFEATEELPARIDFFYKDEIKKDSVNSKHCPECGKELDKYGYCYNPDCQRDTKKLEEDSTSQEDSVQDVGNECAVIEQEIENLNLRTSEVPDGAAYILKDGSFVELQSHGFRTHGAFDEYLVDNQLIKNFEEVALPIFYCNAIRINNGKNFLSEVVIELPDSPITTEQAESLKNWIKVLNLSTPLTVSKNQQTRSYDLHEQEPELIVTKIRSSYDTGVLREGLSIDRETLKKDIQKVIQEVVVDEMLYEPEFVKDYIVVEFSDYEDNFLKIDIRTELDYEQTIRLQEKLDPIIQKIDPRSYFEHETANDLVAFIRKDQSEDEVDEKVVQKYQQMFDAASSAKEVRDLYIKEREALQAMNLGTSEKVLDIIMDAHDKFEQ